MQTPQTASGLRRWWRYRVFLYVVIGLVALDVVLATQRRLWRTYEPDDYWDRVRYCRADHPDLVLIGGSPVSEGVDPALLAGLPWHGRPLQRAYNLGLPGGTATEFWHAVKHGLPRPPRLLVYGISASDVNDGRDEPHGPRSLMTLGDVTDFVRKRPQRGEWYARQYGVGRLSQAWQLYAYRNAIRLWTADQLESWWPGLCPEAAAEARDGLRYHAAMRTHHGFAPRPEFQSRHLDRLKSQGVVWTRFHFLEKYRLGGHLSYVHRLLDWADANGVDVVLVDMPITADLDERLHPQAFATYRAALAELERTRGLTVLRGHRDTVGLTDAHFADLVHLNADGTARFGRWLRGELARLPQAREEASR